MKPTQATCDQKICIRLPAQLLEHINRECKRTSSTASAVVRQSLVEHLAPQERE